MHEETGGVDIELFADILTDLDPILAALTAGAGFRFVAVFDAWQGLTTGPGARCRWGAVLPAYRPVAGPSPLVPPPDRWTGFPETSHAAQRTSPHGVHRNAFGADEPAPG
jgi:hypothetical protein